MMKLILATVCMAGTAMAFSGQSFIPGEPLEGGDSTAVADEINSRLNGANAGMCTFRLFVCVTQKIQRKFNLRKQRDLSARRPTKPVPLYRTRSFLYSMWHATRTFLWQRYNVNVPISRIYKLSVSQNF